MKREYVSRTSPRTVSPLRNNASYTIQTIGLGLALLILASGVALVGYLYENAMILDLGKLIKTLWSNVSTEMGSLAITILVIERMYHRNALQQKKREYLHQMSSPNNGIAVEGARLLAANGWGIEGDKTIEGAFMDFANLRGAKLHGLNLTACAFFKSDISQADLSHSNLMNARLVSANLADSSLVHATLIEANLRASDLAGANLENADLSRACLVRANLSNASMAGATLSQANLSNTIMRNASLSGAIGVGACFFGAVMHGAKIVDGKFAYVDFSQAELRDATLSISDFTGAFFGQADLRGAVFLRANLSRAEGLTIDQLVTLQALAGTRMPDGRLYDGRYRLKGDLKKAFDQGINIQDDRQMAAFYGVSVDEFLCGQRSCPRLD